MVWSVYRLSLCKRRCESCVSYSLGPENLLPNPSYIGPVRKTQIGDAFLDNRAVVTAGSMKGPFVLTLLLLCLLFASPIWAQDFDGNMGFPQTESFAPGGVDVVNEGNMNVHITIPVIHKAGIGRPFAFNLNYDSTFWQLNADGNAWIPAPILPGTYGWKYTFELAYGYISYEMVPYGTCQFGNKFYLTYHEPQGTAHSFGVAYLGKGSGCILSKTVNSTDGSGYTLTVNWGMYRPSVSGFMDRSGNVISVPLCSSQNGCAVGPASITDPNNNKSYTNDGLTFYDTLGLNVLTANETVGDHTTPMTLTYTGGNGSQKYTVNYSPVTISTNFNCNGIADYSQHQVDLVSSIVLPANGGSYTFGYDAEGRINSMTLPTGGVISYAYSGVRCADATATSVTRTVTLGSSHSTWTYSSDSNAQGSGTTTITDPGQNQTTVKFQFYTPILRKIYQGSATGTPLEQITWCYNNVAQPCSTPSGLGLGSPALPALTVLRSLNGGSSDMTVTYYGLHPLWLPTEVDSYDFGASSPMRKVITAYGNYASGTTCNPFTGNIIDRICYTDVEDGNGTVFAQSTDQYDSKGNLTMLGNWTGSTTLNTIYTYYSNGALKTVQDPNGATTTYSSMTCGGGAFPQTISEPLSLSRSMTWDCDGGVVKSITDENGEPTTYDHTDEFWRTTAVTNQGYPATNFSYPDANDFESSMIFNNSTSTVDITTTIDGVGRPILRKKATDPNKDGFDSVGYQYGWNSTGAFRQQSLPYSGSPVAWTTTQYDALGRPSTVTDGGTGTVTYTYTGNDVLQTVSSPSVKKQLEYDSLGRLTSICEITGVSGSGPCGQNQAATGYLTKYTYNALGNLRTVTQNAQPGEIGGTQTRTYYYDALSRLTKEINPENGTTQ